MLQVLISCLPSKGSLTAKIFTCAAQESLCSKCTGIAMRHYLNLDFACRVSYWLDTPVVHPDSLQQLLKEGPSTDGHLRPPLAANRKGQADMHVPPALEIGIAESGQLAVMSAPALYAAPDQALFPQSMHSLAMDFASLDTEAVLLQAAVANACVQLGKETFS